MIKVLLITIILIGVAFAGIGIKMFFKKGAPLGRQCSSVDAKTGKKILCSCGQSEGGADCQNKEKEKYAS